MTVGSCQKFLEHSVSLVALEVGRRRRFSLNRSSICERCNESQQGIMNIARKQEGVKHSLLVTNCSRAKRTNKQPNGHERRRTCDGTPFCRPIDFIKDSSLLNIKVWRSNNVPSSSKLSRLLSLLYSRLITKPTTTTRRNTTRPAILIATVAHCFYCCREAKRSRYPSIHPRYTTTTSYCIMDYLDL